MDNLLRKRLEMIKQRAQRNNATDDDVAAVSTASLDDPLVLEDAARGQEHRIDDERFYLIRREHAHIARDAGDVAQRFARISRRETWPLPSLIYDPGPAMAARIRNDRVCFLDIETTGLSPSTYLFLVGLMFVEDGRFVVEQLFARDYSEETGVLLYLRDMIKKYPMLVTYNGASFDIPFVQTRMAVTRIAGIKPGEHVDLLEAAQRRFKGDLPNCKLETIERHLRGRARRGDIPGWQIPDAYHEFVRSGDAAKIKRILYHNRMDLLAMAYLVNHLADVP